MRSALVLAALIAFGADQAQAQTARAAFGGHSYVYYATPTSFAEADAAARAAGGYLATVTSQGEQDFLHGLTPNLAWLGGSDRDGEGTWRWLGGPEAGQSFYSATGGAVDIGYSAWSAGEPNDFTGFSVGGEDYAALNWGAGGGWNDLDQGAIGAGGPIGYIAEFDTLSGPVSASVTFGGHRYDYFATPLSYADASAAAAALGGYLATVTSQGEQDAIHGLTAAQAWLGGSDAQHEGTWRWQGGPEAGRSFYSATGAPVDIAYSFWSPGEPNNFNGFSPDGENYLAMNRDPSGGWNDFDGAGLGAGGPLGFVVEFGGSDGVPEPATWALMTLGFGALGASVRRRNKRRYATA